MRIEIYNSGMYRARVISQALANGFAELSRDRHIDYAVIQSEYWRGRTDADVVIMYGLPAVNRPIWHGHREAGKTCVLIDMGYLGRLDGGRYSGFHRFSVNDFHPQGYIMGLRVDPKRWRKVQAFLPVKDRWGPIGKHVLIAGMHGKTAELLGYKAEEWEQRMVKEVRRHTGAPILYRPKPSFKQAQGIYGAKLHTGAMSVDQVMNTAKFIISHHSNMGVEAAAYGVPFYQEAGIAQPLSTTLDRIDDAPERTMEERLDLMHRVAYSQYNVAEMGNGVAWRTLEEIGAVPSC